MKENKMKNDDGKPKMSKYALKKMQQKRGNFSPNSPFRRNKEAVDGEEQ